MKNIKLSKEERAKVQKELDSYSLFNDGAGLLLPPFITAILKENGIKKGYYEYEEKNGEKN